MSERPEAEPLDIDALVDRFVGPVYDEIEVTFDAAELAACAAACGETASRYLDPADADFQATPTIPTQLQPKQRFPGGFPTVAGLGMDAGKAIETLAPIRPGEPIRARTHLHEIYTKTGRSGRMVFFVTRMELFDQAEQKLAVSDTRIVIREKPSE
ncbi:MAG: MaoC family dehydratase N-terminal domain-containing protein [Pseudomonadota bacterium]